MGRWQNIAGDKGKTDQARAMVFTKIGREIVAAIKIGGGNNPDTNSKLREVIAKAKANNVPNDNINRAIKKAEEDKSATYEEVVYEGYGPGGVAVIVEAATNNKNRTVSDVRYCLDRAGGSLGNPGSVAFLFQRNGVITVEKTDKFDEDEFTMLALDNGAEDVVVNEEDAQVLTSVHDFHACSVALEEAGYKLISAEIKYIPTTDCQLTSEEQKAQFDKMVEMLEAKDDVINVWSNAV